MSHQLFILLSAVAVLFGLADAWGQPSQSRPLPSSLRVGQLRAPRGPYAASYPGALGSLLEEFTRVTGIPMDTVPVDIADFADPQLDSLPFVYANFADREDWTFSDAEAKKLEQYLRRGGLLFIDAGINAAFLRGKADYGQHHSYAEWDASPELKTAFKKVLPEADFQPLLRSDPLFRAFYAGLPDTSLLPDSVRTYTEKEKWPEGTYSTVVLKVNGRVAVMATPIIAMGWGKNSLGQWITNIQFRVLEDTGGLSEYIGNASYSGMRFEVAREDGGKDVIFCQSEATPSWAREPDGRMRVFRFYGSPEINDFAHVFYIRLGINIIVYALTR